MSLFQPPPILEGTYASYAVYDTFKDTDSTDGYRDQDAVFNEAENIILILDATGEIAKLYTITTKTLGAAIKSDLSYYNDGQYVVGKNRKSAYGSYNVVLAYSVAYEGCDAIHIFKNGVLIQTIEDSTLGITDNKIRAASISPKGKYIIVSGYITAETDMGWVVLEGS